MDFQSFLLGTNKSGFLRQVRKWHQIHMDSEHMGYLVVNSPLVHSLCNLVDICNWLYG